ncbi:synaptic vesicle membrane protein VAT-1 homolog-like isoform X2 [Octopus bimaculoides]|uniref:Enoyl reductase (ER) domain-containing protein n=1 Tax=Octopus bimaculoides TaxID=37653 RepID=A0A0L8GM60_OCTBM|nr:synaptic vesicle membrane protein VAT-1 homolog-like isoform X2 [Octopus bimaculoides]|eukprot:XP_014779832.1 PREDICTED: synaptic vesicle membrane protein VAT-1 homolog-like isoform X2 [Octopus bimaculoides]
MPGDSSDDTTTSAQSKEATSTEDPAKTETPAPKEMKAVVLTGFGGLKMVKIQTKPQPIAGEGQVLIRVKACGVNFLDLVLRQGVIDNPPKTPVIMGYECAGVIEAIGEKVEGINVGDNVIALSEGQCWAEFASVPVKYVYKMPEGMSFHDAAAIAMNYLTAYILLFDIGNLRAGQSVLAHCIAGGVGQAIIQLSKTVDNVTLYGTASAHKHESLKDKVTHVYDHSLDYTQEIRKISPEGVDIVMDCLCGDDTNKGISLLKPMGRYILFGTSSVVTGETKSFFSFAKSWWQVDKISPLKLYDDNKFLAGFQLRQLLFRDNQHAYIQSQMDKLFKLYTDGIIKPVIDQVACFEDIAEAMQRLHDRKNIGKIILDPTVEPKGKSQAADEVKAPSESSATTVAKSEEDTGAESKEAKPEEAAEKTEEAAENAE